MKLSIGRNYTAYINGGFARQGGATFAALNPATGNTWRISRDAVPPMSPRRSRPRDGHFRLEGDELRNAAALLNRLADALEQALPRLATIDAMDIGRRIAETRLDHEKPLLNTDISPERF